MQRHFLLDKDRAEHYYKDLPIRYKSFFKVQKKINIIFICLCLLTGGIFYHTVCLHVIPTDAGQKQVEEKYRTEIGDYQNSVFRGIINSLHKVYSSAEGFETYDETHSNNYGRRNGED